MKNAPSLRALRRFSRNEDGLIAVEALILIPILFFGFAAIYTFFDAYRQSAINLKATYTIGDLVSRETETINNTYIDSMLDLYGNMTRSGSEVKLRVSVIRYDEGTDNYYVDWSANRGFPEALSDTSVAMIRSRLPVMPDEERVILVESLNRYEPPFEVGLSTVEMDNFVFTRPRFTGLVDGDI